jgi:hypothetical protein
VAFNVNYAEAVSMILNGTPVRRAAWLAPGVAAQLQPFVFRGEIRSVAGPKEFLNTDEQRRVPPVVWRLQRALPGALGSLMAWTASPDDFFADDWQLLDE